MLKLKASHFKAYLAEHNYSYQSFADKLGVHKSFINHMANGRRQPCHSNARKMMKLLDKTHEELFEEVQ